MGWIRDPEHWGGGIELAVLAEHYSTELGAVDCQTQRVDLFGQGLGFTERVLLIYDGVHYDLLARAPFAGALTADAPAADPSSIDTPIISTPFPPFTHPR